MIGKKGAGFSFEKLAKLILVLIVVIILFYFLTKIKGVGDMFLSVFG